MREKGEGGRRYRRGSFGAITDEGEDASECIFQETELAKQVISLRRGRGGWASMRSSGLNRAFRNGGRGPVSGKSY